MTIRVANPSLSFISGLTGTTATDIFTFLTEATCIPALGLDHNWVIKSVFPIAQGCNFQLTLPTRIAEIKKNV